MNKIFTSLASLWNAYFGPPPPESQKDISRRILENKKKAGTSKQLHII
jgi:hypothetical protein